MSIRVAGIVGSLREGSLNKGLLRAATELAPAGMEIEIYTRLGDIPPYNDDVFMKGDPEPVADLKNFRQAGFWSSWLGMAPDDSPLLLRDTGTQDIYALDWQAR